MSTTFDSLDDLDRELLAHFASRFPRPATLEVCDYDVDPADAVRLCSDPRAYADPELIRDFMCHVRWSMFGDWRDFPALVGDIAVHCRRDSPLLEGDLGLFFVHLSEAGAFDRSDVPLLRRWVEAVLLPWTLPTPSPGPVLDKHLSYAYLALLTVLGGDPADVLSRNLERSRLVMYTRFCRSLGDSFDEDDIRAFLRHDCVRVANQSLPRGPYVTSPVIDIVVSALRDYYAAVPPLPEPFELDVEQFKQQLYSDEIEQIEDALVTLEGRLFHGDDAPEVDFPTAFVFSELESPPPVRVLERFLGVTVLCASRGCYPREYGNFAEVAFEQTMAVFGFGDGAAARSLARALALIAEPYDRGKAIEDALSTISWIFGDDDTEVTPPPVERVEELLRALLDADDETREFCQNGLPGWICDGMPLWGVVGSLRDAMSAAEWARLERRAAQWLPEEPPSSPLVPGSE